jgi:hypothetical protein
MLQKIKRILDHHGKHLLTFTFFAGFIVDYLTLPNISNPYYPYIGILYGAIVGLFILLKEWQLHLLSIGRGSRRIMSIATVILSFVMGNFLSYVFIYYIRSGDIFSSWPLYIFLLASVFLNEFDFQSSTKLLVNTGLFFIGIIFYTIFNTPLIYKAVNDFVFVRSIILGFLLCYLYAGILSLSVYNKGLTYKLYILAIITPIVVALFYFTNTIPAVPLTLREAAIYSHVNKNTSGNYDFIPVTKVSQTLLGFGSKESVYISKGEPLYFYGAVLAPAKVTSTLSHSWQKYDSVSKKWIEKERIEFPIVGGRKEGYRGYSIIKQPEDGVYRVLVEVGGKRVVGQKVFLVHNL